MELVDDTREVMRAVVFRSFGGPDVLAAAERPMPAAGPDDLVVKVRAAPVNPTDLLMRAGRQASLMARSAPPFIAGMEFSGHVHGVGSRAAAFKVGDAVMGIVDPRRTAGGAHAEYLGVPAGSVVGVPAGIDIVEASAVPMNGMTAHIVLDMLDPATGSTILITGGMGAVGGYVIGLAKRRGLHVIADAKQADRHALLLAGVDTIVPRGEGMIPAVRALFPQGVDALVDAALLGAPAAALVRDGGATVALRASNVITDPRLRNTHVSVLKEVSNTALLQQVAHLLSRGVFRPRIAIRLPFTQAAKAHALVEQGGLSGRVVLTFD